MMKKFDTTWGLYKEFLNWLIRDKAAAEKNGRVINNKITPVISDGINIIYDESNGHKEIILNGNIIYDLFSLSKQVFFYVVNASIQISSRCLRSKL